MSMSLCIKYVKKKVNIMWYTWITIKMYSFVSTLPYIVKPVLSGKSGDHKKWPHMTGGCLNKVSLYEKNLIRDNIGL
jgi:hypothetical protein